jgi:hypothetical protein
VVTLVNLIFLHFGMLYTAGLRRHSVQLAGNPMKHTSSLGLHEILETRQIAESKVMHVQPFCEVDGPARQLQLRQPCS